MRKYQQTQILNLIETINNAVDELPKIILKQQNANSCITLLSDCQECSFALIEYINNIMGTETETALLLEEFVKSLFTMSQLTSDLASKNIKELKRQLCEIEQSVRNELKPAKIEMVFFPYQLSMFDSLESIYLAAKADPDCDAYCVPIPWYDKLPNGELGQMHYDGNQYPDYIDVTDWREYDVEARHPDAIFIHNPYDEGNYITSVHPDFYSSRLYEHTDCLCYVPYFVSNGEISESFIITTGNIYAHKVFVQSEQERQRYIQVLYQTFGNQLNGIEDKFVVLGSPKFDHITNPKSDDYELPTEWAQLIQNEAGTPKKIVLYNTTINAALQNSEQYLKKLRHVLDTFKKYNDIVLWWRPHPLLESTFESMRPDLAQEYKQIVAQYCNPH